MKDLGQVCNECMLNRIKMTVLAVTESWTLTVRAEKHRFIICAAAARSMFYSEHNRTERFEFSVNRIGPDWPVWTSQFMFLPLMELTRKTTQGTYPTSSFSFFCNLAFLSARHAGVRQTSVGNALSTVDPALGQKDGLDDLLRPHLVPLSSTLFKGNNTTGKLHHMLRIIPLSKTQSTLNQ